MPGHNKTRLDLVMNETSMTQENRCVAFYHHLICRKQNKRSVNHDFKPVKVEWLERTYNFSSKWRQIYGNLFAGIDKQF